MAQTTTASEPTDLVVIGGGINGCGIARDAAGRGLSVVLLEQGDLASGTSSTSTKMIHGGLRYLEHYAFKLVRESLLERELLWRAAPHIVEPLRIVLPHHKGLRPAWLIRLGLWLYDHIGGRSHLPGTAHIDLTKDSIGKPLVTGLTRAFEYSDCWVDDARLVTLNAVHAAELGASIETRSRVVSLVCQDGVWHLDVEGVDGSVRTVHAKAVVNAAGPWVSEVLQGAARRQSRSQVRLVRGSHLVVPRLHHDDRGYLFQNADNRVIFVLPYEQDFSLIGTTDIDHDGSASEVAASEEEIAYLCQAVGEYLHKPLDPASVVHHFSGLRPLYDDGSTAAQEATRDYVFELDTDSGAPLLSVFGGKITTYRRLALDALERLMPTLPHRGEDWTCDVPLPGGAFPMGGRDDLVVAAAQRWPFVPETTSARWVRSYGTRVHRMMEGVQCVDDLGRDFGHGLYQKEVDYLIAVEFARSAEDILWRRSKLGLRFNESERDALASYCETGLAAA